MKEHMGYFDFSSPESHAYTNINNLGFSVYCRRNGWKVTSYKRDIFHDLLHAGDLKPSDIKQITVNADTADLTNNHIRLLTIPRVLIIDMETALENPYKDIIATRTAMNKTTITFIDHLQKPDAVTVLEAKQMFRKDHYTGWLKNFVPKHRCFIDIDGVLLTFRESLRSRWACTNVGHFREYPSESAARFDRAAILFLRKLSAYKGVEFVLSSAWRHGLSKQEISALGRYLGIPIVGCTISRALRNDEIEQYMKTFPINGKSFTIDDEDIQVDGLQVFRVNGKEGVSWKTMEEICEFLDVNIYDFTNSQFLYQSQE